MVGVIICSKLLVGRNKVGETVKQRESQQWSGGGGKKISCQEKGNTERRKIVVMAAKNEPGLPVVKRH